MSSTTFLKNAVIRHAIFLQRFGGGESKDLQLAVVSARRVAKRTMPEQEIINISRKRQIKLLKTMSGAVRAEFDKTIDKTIADMDKFAAQEVGFNERMLEGAVKGTVNPARAATVNSLIFNKPIAFGIDKRLVLDVALKDFSKKKTKQILQVVRDGILKGESNKTMRRGINTVTSKLQTRQADALVRTTVNHVSNSARRAVMNNNKDVVEAMICTAVLDSRTTDICGGLDGKVLP